MSPIPIIIVWGVLGIILIAYVIYRLVTDKQANKKRHIMYPFVSHPTDPTLPKSKLALFCYLFMLAGITGVILQLTNEVGLFSISQIALTSLQACMPVGVILFFVVKGKNSA